MNKFRQFSQLLKTSEPSPKLQELCDTISHLSLLETSDLVKLLKEKLNISEIVQVQSQAPVAAVKVEETKEEQTEFQVTLEKFEPSGKAKIIREIKGIVAGLNLVQAKNFVESAPKVVKEKATKEEAENLKKLLEPLGATIKID